MSFKSELEVMKALDIETWRNVSKDKVLEFVKLIPDIDQEVALEVIRKVPELRHVAKDAIDSIEKHHASTLSANSESQAQMHGAFQEARAIFGRQLDREDLSREQFDTLIDAIQDTLAEEAVKDTENKRFLRDLFREGARMSLAGVALIGVAVAGSRAIRR